MPGDRRVPRIRWALRWSSPTRKQAEQNLAALSAQPSFLAALLQLVVTPNQDRSVRLAASVYLKNTVKERRRRIAALAVVVESIDNHRDEPLIPDSEKPRL